MFTDMIFKIKIKNINNSKHTILFHYTLIDMHILS